MKYPFIKAWGKYMMSKDYYIKAEQEIAERDNAPERAIYKSVEGEWHVIDNVGNPEAKQFCLDWVANNVK
jgi:hypothetical protein